MNVSQLLNRVAAQLEEDMLEDDTRALAVAYIAEAHHEMMRIYKPFIDVEILVPEDGKVPVSQLGERTGQVMRVRRGCEELPFAVVGKYLQVYYASGDKVYVHCRYQPEQLENDGDVPQLPEAFHGALADYATYRVMGNGGRTRQQRGEMYYGRYLQKKVMIAPESSEWRDYVIRKYQ